MCRMIAIAMLIFSLIPSLVQARQDSGSQSVAIAISLTIAPDMERRQRSIHDCIDRSVDASQRAGNLTCPSRNLMMDVTETQGDVAIRLIPI